MESRATPLTGSEAFAALAQRGWNLAEDGGALTCTHQDGTTFVVKNAYIRTEGFNRGQLLDRIAAALVDSALPKPRD